MRARRSKPGSPLDQALVAQALDALDAEGLRTLIRGIVPWLDEATHARLVNALIDQGARGRSGWTPPSPSAARVSAVESFATAAIRVGSADAADVDAYLREGSNAFLSKDYRAAFAIFSALLLPAGRGEIDLGQHEMLEEVLGVDLADCAAQYVVSAYMTAPAPERGPAIVMALDDAREIGHWWNPLREMERVAVEPLPDFQEFLPAWRTVVEAQAANERKSEWDTDADRWLREVTVRLEGANGLARIARATKRADDLRAWCSALIDAQDWRAALSACDEAAERGPRSDGVRAEFLDQAALAAQELGRRDVPVRLERAWRAAPSLVRLRRWLGTAKSQPVLKRRAISAVDACPKGASCQRALLHVIVGDLESAARLLAAAPGLGWSDSEHPGHVIFWVLVRLLGGRTSALQIEAASIAVSNVDDEIVMAGDNLDDARSSNGLALLAAPQIDDLIALAAVKAPTSEKTRDTILKGLRRAAEKRAAGVVEHKRRRHYGHAARLIAVCAIIDPTAQTAAWLAGFRVTYRRHHALQHELDRGVECEGR